METRINKTFCLSHKNTVKSKFSNKSIANYKKDSRNDIIIPDEVKQKYFINVPYYNFIYAEDELGFCFSEFAKNNFGEFLQTCYVLDLIKLRKSYILRNFSEVRFIAHKFKSPFGFELINLG